MSRRLTRSCVVLAVCAAVAVPVAAAEADAGPGATAARACKLKLSEQRNMGTTYVFSLSARGGATCRGAKSLARRYHACRHRKGPGGKCGAVSRYRCSERRYNKSRFSYDATATCRKGEKKVVQKYQQNI